VKVVKMITPLGEAACWNRSGSVSFVTVARQASSANRGGPWVGGTCSGVMITTLPAAGTPQHSSSAAGSHSGTVDA
jgi:hypothetical protein